MRSSAAERTNRQPTAIGAGLLNTFSTSLVFSTPSASSDAAPAMARTSARNPLADHAEDDDGDDDENQGDLNESRTHAPKTSFGREHGSPADAARTLGAPWVA